MFGPQICMPRIGQKHSGHQVYILDYTSNQLREFLVELGVETEPETDLVIKHLLYCSNVMLIPHMLRTKY